MPGDRLEFDILAHDHASRDIRQVGRAAAETGGKLDIAALSLKAFDAATISSGKAARTSEQALRSHIKADQLFEDAMRVAGGQATKFTKLMSDQGRELDRTGKKAASTAGAFTALAGTGGIPGGGMGALIGAVGALSPVLVTLGGGIAGLGLAAVGSRKQILATSQPLRGLKSDYASFTKALEPTVLKDFNAAIGAARPVLHGLQPVAAAAGDALAQLFDQVGAEFRSSEWQDFFAFMARTAGPDVRLLGNAILDLTRLVPPLVQDLQPLAEELLRDADGAVKVASALEKAAHGAADFGTSIDQRLGQATGVSGVRSFGDLIGGLAEGVGKLVPALRGILPSGSDAKGFAEGMVLLGRDSHAAAGGLRDQAHALTNLTAGYKNALGPLGDYIGATLTERNDLHQLRAALRDSGGAVGYKTQKERDSFAAAQTYITDTLRQGDAALKAHRGIGAQIASLRDALPALESVKGKTAAYKQELGLLRDMLDQLRAERDIVKHVSVVFSTVGGTGPFAGKVTGFATGGLVAGGVPGKDSVPILAMPGEAVVPRRLTPAVAPFLKAHGVPGFADGGLVPQPRPPLVQARAQAGSVVYNINVSVPPNANLREIGRITVEAIKAYEKGSGTGWRR